MANRSSPNGKFGIRRLRTEEPLPDMDHRKTITKDREATIGHLQDIHSAHGIGVRWASYEIGHEPGARFVMPTFERGSMVGSAADMCAE